jgi:hypothetical protein
VYYIYIYQFFHEDNVEGQHNIILKTHEKIDIYIYLQFAILCKQHILVKMFAHGRKKAGNPQLRYDRGCWHKMDRWRLFMAYLSGLIPLGHTSTYSNMRWHKTFKDMTNENVGGLVLWLRVPSVYNILSMGNILNLSPVVTSFGHRFESTVFRYHIVTALSVMLRKRLYDEDSPLHRQLLAQDDTSKKRTLIYEHFLEMLFTSPCLNHVENIDGIRAIWGMQPNLKPGYGLYLVAEHHAHHARSVNISETQKILSVHVIPDLLPVILGYIW